MHPAAAGQTHAQVNNCSPLPSPCFGTPPAAPLSLCPLLAAPLCTHRWRGGGRFLCACAAGQWVVSEQWLTASVTAGRLVDEAPFLVLGDTQVRVHKPPFTVKNSNSNINELGPSAVLQRRTQGTYTARPTNAPDRAQLSLVCAHSLSLSQGKLGGPARGRERSGGEQRLLHGWRVYLHGDYVSPPRADLVTLVLVRSLRSPLLSPSPVTPLRHSVSCQLYPSATASCKHCGVETEESQTTSCGTRWCGAGIGAHAEVCAGARAGLTVWNSSATHPPQPRRLWKPPLPGYLISRLLYDRDCRLVTATAGSLYSRPPPQPAGCMSCISSDRLGGHAGGRRAGVEGVAAAAGRPHRAPGAAAGERERGRAGRAGRRLV